jgi:hypothetical protein
MTIYILLSKLLQCAYLCYVTEFTCQLREPFFKKPGRTKFIFFTLFHRRLFARATYILKNTTRRRVLNYLMSYVSARDDIDETDYDTSNPAYPSLRPRIYRTVISFELAARRTNKKRMKKRVR